MAVALSSVLLMLSSFFGLMELSVGAIASLLVVFIFVEVGNPYHWMVWLATSVISILLFPSKTIGVGYFLVFGIYPILKAYIERLPRWSWIIVKFLYFTAVGGVFILLSELVLGVPFFQDLPDYAGIVGAFVKGGFILLCYIALFAYDMFIAVMTRLYFLRFRDKIKRILK